MATSTFTTGGGVNLNDQSVYWLNKLDLGKSNRNEFWLPMTVKGAVDQLGGYVDSHADMTIELRVKGSSVADLQNKMNAVRNQFITTAVAASQGGDNYITYTLPGGTPKTIVTYASPIDPIVLSNDEGGISVLAVAARQFFVNRWTFVVHRQAYFVEDAATFRTPAI